MNRYLNMMFFLSELDLGVLRLFIGMSMSCSMFSLRVLDGLKADGQAEEAGFELSDF